MTKDELYDVLYDEADQLLKQYNPCQIRKEGAIVKCVRSGSTKYEHPLGSLCCGGCKHLGPQGCTVKALACKVWLCVWDHPREVRQGLRAITIRAQAAGLHLGIRLSKEEVMEKSNEPR